MAKTVTAKMLEEQMQAHVKAETGLSLENASARDYWTALSKMSLRSMLM